MTTAPTPDRATELLDAARVAVLEYFSHGGAETHRECPAVGRYCYMPAYMERLAKAVDAYDGPPPLTEREAG